LIPRPDSLDRRLPHWACLEEELQRVLAAAERNFALFGDDALAPMFVASPYILALERLLVQTIKRNLPAFAAATQPEKPVQSFVSADRNLVELLARTERIGLGHVVNWLARVARPDGDEILELLSGLLLELDPHQEFFTPRTVRLLQRRVVPMRKYCVHVSRLETWPTAADARWIRQVVLFECLDWGEGLVPRLARLAATNLGTLLGEAMHPDQPGNP